MPVSGIQRGFLIPESVSTPLSSASLISGEFRYYAETTVSNQSPTRTMYKLVINPGFRIQLFHGETLYVKCNFSNVPGVSSGVVGGGPLHRNDSQVYNEKMDTHPSGLRYYEPKVKFSRKDSVNDSFTMDISTYFVLNSINEFTSLNFSITVYILTQSGTQNTTVQTYTHRNILFHHVTQTNNEQPFLLIGPTVLPTLFVVIVISAFYRDKYISIAKKLS